MLKNFHFSINEEELKEVKGLAKEDIKKRLKALEENVETFIKQLDEIDRKILLLRIKGSSYRAIEKELELSLSRETIRRRYMKTQKKLYIKFRSQLKTLLYRAIEIEKKEHSMVSIFIDLKRGYYRLSPVLIMMVQYIIEKERALNIQEGIISEIPISLAISYGKKELFGKNAFNSKLKEINLPLDLINYLLHKYQAVDKNGNQIDLYLSKPDTKIAYYKALSIRKNVHLYALSLSSHKEILDIKQIYKRFKNIYKEEMITYDTLNNYFDTFDEFCFIDKDLVIRKKVLKEKIPAHVKRRILKDLKIYLRIKKKYRIFSIDYFLESYFSIKQLLPSSLPATPELIKSILVEEGFISMKGYKVSIPKSFLQEVI